MNDDKDRLVRRASVYLWISLANANEIKMVHTVQNDSLYNTKKYFPDLINDKVLR